ncbi:MAG TPA: flagellar hook-basal body protein [Phycisphaerales bacterium]|nr:flagellar hook-basal body protein [Phycisphaerales bacterium]
MNYGLNISASGALSAMYRQDVLSNNLANINTVGFKPDQPSVRYRPAVREEDGLSFMPSNDLLEKLGGGVQVVAPRTKFEQGTIELTSDPLDLAIKGDGFFVVRSETSDGADRLRLTRDGKFTIGSNGQLVTSSGGLPVLDSQNRPIEVSRSGKITIDADGTLRQDGAEIARLRLVEFADPSQLRKVGSNLFAAPAGAMANARPATGNIVQGAVERASIDEIRTMLDIQDAARTASSNLNMIRYQDQMNERAIAQLGRIA